MRKRLSKHARMARLPEPHRMEAETYQLAVISTAHVTGGTADAFDEASDVIRGPYGWVLWVPTDPDEEDDTPAEVRGILEWARRHRFGYVMLDSDAPIISDLPSFDW